LAKLPVVQKVGRDLVVAANPDLEIAQHPMRDTRVKVCERSSRIGLSSESASCCGVPVNWARLTGVATTCGAVDVDVV
jgi:hypothetical protein